MHYQLHLILRCKQKPHVHHCDRYSVLLALVALYMQFRDFMHGHAHAWTLYSDILYTDRQYRVKHMHACYMYLLKDSCSFLFYSVLILQISLCRPTR